MIFIWAPLSVFRSHFFAWPKATQKEFRSSRGADREFFWDRFIKIKNYAIFEK